MSVREDTHMQMTRQLPYATGINEVQDTLSRRCQHWRVRILSKHMAAAATGETGANVPWMELVELSDPGAREVLMVTRYLSRCDKWVFHGPVTIKDERGQVVASGTYVHGSRDGLWREWHPSGQLATEGRYCNQLEVGVWRYYDQDGNLEDEDVFTARPPEKSASALERPHWQGTLASNP
jgi:hypothetical protein